MRKHPQQLNIKNNNSNNDNNDYDSTRSNDGNLRTFLGSSEKSSDAFAWLA